MSVQKNTNMKKLISVDSDINAGIIIDLLQQTDIHGYIKDLETGSYMSIYMGYSIFGKEIYVGEADFEKAKQMIDVLKEQPDHSIDTSELQKNLPFYKNKRIVARIMLAVTVITGLVLLLIALL